MPGRYGVCAYLEACRQAKCVYVVNPGDIKRAKKPLLLLQVEGDTNRRRVSNERAQKEERGKLRAYNNL